MVDFDHFFTSVRPMNFYIPPLNLDFSRQPTDAKDSSAKVELIAGPSATGNPPGVSAPPPTPMPTTRSEEEKNDSPLPDWIEPLTGYIEAKEGDRGGERPGFLGQDFGHGFFSSAGGKTGEAKIERWEEVKMDRRPDFHGSDPDTRREGKTECRSLRLQETKFD